MSKYIKKYMEAACNNSKTHVAFDQKGERWFWPETFERRCNAQRARSRLPVLQKVNDKGKKSGASRAGYRACTRVSYPGQAIIHPVESTENQ